MRITEDGGVTWTATCFPEGVSGFVSALMFRGDRGWAVVTTAEQRGLILRSSDGGRRWTLGSTPEGTTRLSDITFVDDDHGWAVGASPAAPLANPKTGSGALVLHTEDGGATWTAVTLAPDLAGGLRRVSFVDRLHGWAAGQTAGGAPALLATSDGGTTWAPVSLPNDFRELEDVTFADPSHGWAVGNVFPEQGGGDTAIIFATADGGLSWTESRLAKVVLWDLHFLDAARGWAAGGGTEGVLFSTVDGGTTWTRSDVPTKAITSVFFSDPAHGWAGGLQGACLVATEDGGTTWTRQCPS